MQTSIGDVLIWRTITEVLQSEEPAEFEMADELFLSSISKPSRIKRQPGAFSMGDMSLTASAFIAVIAPIALAVAPKLFDALLDVSKESLKQFLNLKISLRNKGQLTEVSISAGRIRELVRNAATSRNLSRRTADALADALISQLAELHPEFLDGKEPKA